MTTSTPPDVIDVLTGIAPGSRLDELRRRRPVTREQAQAAYAALFEPRDDAAVPTAERWLIAAYTTRLAADDATAAFYRERAELADPEHAAIVTDEAAAAAAVAVGPFGRYPEAGLQQENTEGVRYRAAAAVRAQLGGRLTAGLEHAHLLVLRPREADRAALTALTDAGWSTDAVVTLSQLVSFLAFQQRVVRGLRTIDEEEAA
ncbi:CMD domain protein [Microbacterium pullorum]|uniref:CMD domain protein n=1 Tax=Microbacterium pullorum TaxID=2762236 RepID=UPI00296AE6C1|nr:CMD domain protein [Microbacterium pullorum]